MKTIKNRLHIDLRPGDARIERLVGLGATRIDVVQHDKSRVVLADPEDNELCVVSSH